MKTRFLSVLLCILLAPTLGFSQTAKSYGEKLDESTDEWVGTAWGLGLPQTTNPGDGKINCGMFVGLLLKNLGLNINYKKLQRQPSELIIKSVSKKQNIKRYRNWKMQRFVDDVQTDNGWFILGLDNHVGFVRVVEGVATFVHADYVTGKVVKEPLIGSPSVQSSKYRVIGKIFDDRMIKWLDKGTRVKVIGDW